MSEVSRKYVLGRALNAGALVATFLLGAYASSNARNHTLEHHGMRSDVDGPWLLVWGLMLVTALLALMGVQVTASMEGKLSKGLLIATWIVIALSVLISMTMRLTVPTSRLM